VVGKDAGQLLVEFGVNVVLARLFDGIKTRALFLAAHS